MLSGAPSSPLSLQAGEPSQNLAVFYYEETESNTLSGLGPLGFPDFDAIGDGSIAVLVDYDRSEFGFDRFGGDGGTAIVNVFARDGSLIDMFEITGFGDDSYAFRRTGRRDRLRR